MCQSFTVDDLKYLKKTGRVSGAAAIIGNVLGIHPVPASGTMRAR